MTRKSFIDKTSRTISFILKVSKTRNPFIWPLSEKNISIGLRILGSNCEIRKKSSRMHLWNDLKSRRIMFVCGWKLERRTSRGMSAVWLFDSENNFSSRTVIIVSIEPSVFSWKLCWKAISSERVGLFWMDYWYCVCVGGYRRRRRRR